jgi:hypothetical protein
MSDQYWHMGGATGLIARSALRTLQFVFAIIVSALYGVDLHESTKTNTHANSAWIFAEVVACISILTCAIHCFVTIKRVAWCAWDWVVFFLWISQFGVFAAVYIGGGKTEDGYVTESVMRMKVAVWIDLVNVLLWFSTAVGGIVWCCTERKVTRRTERLELGEEAKDVFVNRQLTSSDGVDEKLYERELMLEGKPTDTEAKIPGEDLMNLSKVKSFGEESTQSTLNRDGHESMRSSQDMDYKSHAMIEKDIRV